MKLDESRYVGGTSLTRPESPARPRLGDTLPSEGPVTVPGAKGPRDVVHVLVSPGVGLDGASHNLHKVGKLSLLLVVL